MSSTNRSNARNTHISDYYITPQKPIEEFLSAFLQDEDIHRPDRLIWLDPCAGGDKNNPMSYPTVIKNICDPTIMTIDIREDSLAELKTDYLTHQLPQDYKPNIIITNPPFDLALPIIKKALNDVADDGYVIMLLRLNFWGSKARRPFFIDNNPKYCYIHPRRMSFTDDGKTDSIEYAHFVWKKGENPKFCLTSLL